MDLRSKTRRGTLADHSPNLAPSPSRPLVHHGSSHSSSPPPIPQRFPACRGARTGSAHTSPPVPFSRCYHRSRAVPTRVLREADAPWQSWCRGRFHIRIAHPCRRPKVAVSSSRPAPRTPTLPHLAVGTPVPSSHSATAHTPARRSSSCKPRDEAHPAGSPELATKPRRSYLPVRSSRLLPPAPLLSRTPRIVHASPRSGQAQNRSPPPGAAAARRQRSRRHPSRTPMKNVPAGTTTNSGQVEQSRNTVPGGRIGGRASAGGSLAAGRSAARRPVASDA